MTQEDVVKFALTLAGTEKRSHMGRPDLRVGGKIFATLPEDGASVNLRVPALTLETLVEKDPETFESIWKGRMLGVSLARVDPKMLRALLLEAWTVRAPTSVTSPKRKR
jgi:hypothetical protein